MFLELLVDGCVRVSFQTATEYEDRFLEPVHVLEELVQVIELFFLALLHKLLRSLNKRGRIISLLHTGNNAA